MDDSGQITYHQYRWGNAAAIDGQNGLDRQDGQNAEEMARCKKTKGAISSNSKPLLLVS